jgi:hypothetical protein
MPLEAFLPFIVAMLLSLLFMVMLMDAELKVLVLL